VKRLAFLLFAAACGDNRAAPADAPRAVDASPTDGSEPALCAAKFSGKFSLTETLPADCATLSTDGSGTELTFDLFVPPIATSLSIAIGLPTPAVTGDYTDESVTQWSAMATQAMGTFRCYYIAGSSAVPPGTFSMTVDAVDGTEAHGRLVLELAVLAGAENNCGPENLEDLALSF
jgi:hypothetical protein